MVSQQELSLKIALEAIDGQNRKWCAFRHSHLMLCIPFTDVSIPPFHKFSGLFNPKNFNVDALF
jgi:hypothetical protein